MPGTGATDAGASRQDRKAGIGGWYGTKTDSRWDVHWFMIPITPTSHPWVDAKDDDPQRFISSLELLADVYMVEYLSERHAGQAGQFYAPLTTDNYGNTFIIKKHWTPTFPNCCLVMELTDRLINSDMYLRIEHRDREDNEWADQLAGQDDTGFDPDKRWTPTAPMKIFDTTYKMAMDMGMHRRKDEKQKEYLQKQRDQQRDGRQPKKARRN